MIIKTVNIVVRIYCFRFYVYEHTYVHLDLNYINKGCPRPQITNISCNFLFTVMDQSVMGQ